MPVEIVDIPLAYEFLQEQFKARSGYAANKDRKNLATAWKWGRTYIKNFPYGIQNPFRTVDTFPEVRSERYVPPVEDFWKVYRVATGQDQIMLLAYLHLAGRRNEIFRLKTSDADFENDKIRLWTRKRKGGNYEFDWLPMTTELREALSYWIEIRKTQPTINSEHLFVCLSDTAFCDQYYGKPFTSRQHLMKRLCTKAKVKPFGFHSIRHLTATILYHKGYDVSFIQRVLRHQNPTTTEKYLKRLGLESVRNGLEESLSVPENVVSFKKYVSGKCQEGQKVSG